MASPRPGLIAACTGIGLAIVVGLMMMAYRHGDSGSDPGHGSTAPETPGTKSEPAEPIVDWHQNYDKAIASRGRLDPGFKVGKGFVTAAAIGPRGELLLGTEDEGLFIYDGQSGSGNGWSVMASADSLAENAVYALAADRAGRIWAGHGRSGVSVWNGKEWRHYGVGLGPLGERIFSIAAGPDGSVWLATSAGLTRYDDRHGWRHYTTAHGLPGLHAIKLAFAPNGKLFAAMQATGLAIATPEDDYSRFQAVPALRPALVAEDSGQGLPSNLCNDLAITPQGHIYVATCYGLARSIDDGTTFWYFRGFGGAEETAENSPESSPPPGEPTAPCIGKGMLPWDFVSTLAADAAGRVYVGYRERGSQILAAAEADPRAKPRILGKLDCSEPTVMAMAPGGYLLVAQTKDGARLIECDQEQPAPFKMAAAGPAPLPAPAAAPSLEELTQLLKQMRSIKSYNGGYPVAPLEDDWSTEGAYLGRHGKYFAALAAMVSPSDLTWGTGADRASYHVSAPEHALRYYIHSNHTREPSALELPMPYLDSRVRQKLTTWDVDRREAEWNDFGNGKERAKDGPHVFVNLRIPDGLYIMSLYFHNKDAHTGPNSRRDYALSVREPNPANTTQGFSALPELARSRVRQIWHGVYKQFLVEGPRNLLVQVDRNHSHFAVVAAAMLDEADEQSTAYFATREERAERRAADLALREKCAGQTRPLTPPASAAEAADALFAELDLVRAINPREWGLHRRPACEALLRFYRARQTPEARRKLATCCYHLHLFEEWEKLLAEAGEKTPRSIEKTLRWDGRSDGYPAMNYDQVRALLAAPQAEKPPEK